MDVEISVDENILLKEAHEIAEQVHEAIEKAFPQVKHCMVHVNPIIKLLISFTVSSSQDLSTILSVASLKISSAAFPIKIALIAAIVSILVKEWMYWYTRAAAKKINSGALMADAWHHRFSIFSSTEISTST